MSIMKNLIKLFVVMFVATFVFISCEKGGTIVVKNGDTDTYAVIIVKPSDSVEKQKKDLEDGNVKGKLISPGKTEKFPFDEDGLYTVCALSQNTATKYWFAAPVTLVGGGTFNVTIEKGKD